MPVLREINLTTGLFPFALVGALTVSVWHRQGPTNLDRSLLGGYRPVSTSGLFRITRVFTELGSPAAVILCSVAAAAFVWRQRRSWLQSLACIVAPAAAGVTQVLAKAIVARPRPTTAVLSGEGGMGFPSGHASSFAALLIILALILPDRPATRATSLMFAAIASMLMALSRVIVGAHYPTDVIAGVLIGWLLADATCTAMRITANRLRDVP